MLRDGDRLLVAHRRLFLEDQPRFFTGFVDGHENAVVSASGYSWVRDPFTGDFTRTAGQRTKIFSLVSGSLMVYRLPVACRMEQLEFVLTSDQQLVLRDGAGFELEMTEHPAHMPAIRRHDA